uniref:OSIGBa0092J07.1 protein n=1 Tax=Oryza sativa TaxID=4530 RepID=Q01KR6_ORYSA|nr:OSIGBa0146I21.6 [Oryza sativa]CAH66655.1 OSIGBa0092J07.1 [Oryza sativa]
MRASTRTCQGVIIKPGPRPKLAPDSVSNDEVSQSIQQQIAFTIDSSMIVFKDQLDATFEGKFDEFLRVKFGPLLADHMVKNKASITANQPPIDQTGNQTEGTAYTAGPTGPDGRSDRDTAVGPTGQTAGQTGYYPGGQTGTQAGPTAPLDAGQTGHWAGQTGAIIPIQGIDPMTNNSYLYHLRTFDPPVSTATSSPQVHPHVHNAYNDVARGYPPDTRQGQYNHIAPQTQPIRPTNPPPNQQGPNNMEDIISDITRNRFGIETRNRARTYKKPYPDYYDNVSFPRNYRVPEFAKFSGEDVDYPEASDSEEEGDHDIYVAEWSWTNKNKPFVYSNLMPTPRKDRQSEVKYSFDVAKCDKIFDYLLQEKQIRLPKGHVIPSQEELKRRPYCKWHDSHSHSTNDCNVFRRQVQSAIDEGRLKFTNGSKMKLDDEPFPVNTINFNDKKVLIRLEQAESTKGKEVVIGEPMPKMIVPKKPEVGVWKQNKSGASTSNAPRKTKVTFDMLLEKYERQGGEKIRNKGKRPRSPPRERFGHSPRWSHSPSYHHPQDMSWGPYPMPPPGYSYPYFMPWGATPPMFNHMPPMQFNQGWGGPRRLIHECLSSPNNSQFYGKNQANEEKREGKRVKMEERTSKVITVKVGSHDVPILSGDGVGVSPNKKSEAGASSSQSVGLTRPSGRSDRGRTTGLTGPLGRSDHRPDGGTTDASSRSDRAPHVGLTGASGRSDRWSTAGLTGLQRRFDERAAKGDVRASSSSNKINRGHYLPPGIEPNPRWMPKDLTATQKKRLQRLRAQELREKKAEEQRDKWFNELRPPPVWRPKSIEKEKPIDVEEKKEQSVNKGELSPKEDMDINMVCMLPMEFCAMDEAEVAQLSLGPKDAVFEKSDESNPHMKSLYLKGLVDGKPVSRMLVDGGAAVNLMPYSLFKKLGREDDELKKTNMILNGFNGEPTEAKGIFSAELTVGNTTLPTAFFIVDVQEANLEWLQKRVQEYRSTMNDIGETVENFEEIEKLGKGFTSADPLKEVDIGDGTKPRPTFVNKNVRADHKVKIIELLKEYVDCFAWEYHEMLGLSRELVEHRLPIKPGFRPYKQPPRHFNPLLYDRVKEEIDRLLKAGFIRPCHYAEWVSSIVPVEKKGSGKIRVCIDLNKATPKDEYPRPIADMMINDASGHKVISFLDGNAGYNQIFMAEEDMYKTAFRCPGFVGLFEWVVMTFGLKNAGATYQRAMNLIFHDLVGTILEIYIDDIVVKSDGMEGHIADLRLAFERMRRYGLKMNPLKCAFGVSAGKFLGFMVDERGVEIDPKKIEKIRDFKAPTSGKIDAFVPKHRLKKEADFTWGAKQQEMFEELKRYLSTPPVVHIARHDNSRANDLAQQASGYNLKNGLFLILEEPVLDFRSLCEIGKAGDQGRSDRRCTAGLTGDQGRSDRLHAAGLTGDPERSDRPCVADLTGSEQNTGGHVSLNLEAELIVNSDICAQDAEEDWRIRLIRYLKDPTLKVDRKIRRQAFKYTLLDEDLYRRNIDGVLLKCLDGDQSKVAMGEGHRFVLVAMDYFTKWTEAVPFKNMTHTEAIDFILKHIIHRFGIPQTLTMDQEAVLPVEVNLGSLRYMKQDDLSSEDYKTLMGDNLDEVIDKRLKALEEIEKEKKRVAKAYNKRVKAKLFQVGDLVWKTILPLGTRSKEFGNAYFLETLQGERFQRAINGKYLKKYFPSVWQDA